MNKNDIIIIMSSWRQLFGGEGYE